MICRTVTRLLSLELCLLLAGCFACIYNSCASAAEVAPTVQQSGDIAYRRVFVPAESPEAWPVGSERYLPIPRDEFSRLVEQSQSSKASKQHGPIHVSSAVYRAELISDDTLQGEAEWTVEIAGAEPQLLPLSPLNLVIRSAHWQKDLGRHDPTQAASVGLWQGHDHTMELAVLAQKSDTLQLKWQLAARRIDEARADFSIKTPIIVPQTFELQLPANCSATLSDSELVRTDIGSQGESRWVFQLAPRELHRLQINQLGPTKATRTQPLVSQSTSYLLEPSGLSVVTQLRLDAREAPITELRAALAGGLRIVDVTIDQQPVTWRVVDNGEEQILVIPRPESLQPQSLRIRCLAKFRSDTTWELPKLRFEEVAWTAGTTSLLISPNLELRSLNPQQATLQHIVGIADNAGEGEVFRLQEWSQDAALEIEVGRPLPNLTARTATTIEFGRDQSKASIVALLSSSGGDVYQVQAEVAAGWAVDSVTATPKAALNEWHIDRSGSSSRIRFQLNQPVSKESALRVEIKARETRGKPLLPATVGQLRLLRFQRAAVRQQLLQLRTRKSEQLALPDRLDRARLAPNEIGGEFSELLPKSSVGTTIDVTYLDEGEVIEFRQQTAKYQAKLQIEIDALADSFQHRYQLDCRLQSGAVSEILLELDEPLPEAMQWKLVGQRGTIALERMDDLESQDPSPNSNVGYLLRLPKVMTEDFRLQASYSQPARRTERCNLLRLPRSIDWSGQVILSGSLEGFHVLDQGWTPTVSVSSKFEHEQLPVLGVYRLGPEEIRRGSATAGLRLERLRKELLVPQLTAWLAEYRTLQAANGDAIHTASYSLENLGIGEAEVILPADAELQEAWLDNQQLEPKKIALQDNAYRFRFGNAQGWPSLVLKYSTRTAPLGGSASLQPVVPQCSFPVTLGRWTLWAPEQYEIDHTQQDYSYQRYHWWKRIFGPLARSRGETVFNPLQGNSWTQVWSEPLVGQQTKQQAEKIASQLAERLETDISQPLGILLNDLTDENQMAESFYVDRAALLVKGIQANTSCVELIAASRTARSPNTLGLPLSSYRLAMLVSPGMIVLTTAERVAHWHDQLRPTEASGVFMVSSDDLVDSLERNRSSRTSDIVRIAVWQSAPPVERPQWTSLGVAELVDVGRRAQTVEFTEGRPTLIVRRAFVQRALWYAVVLLTLVLGVWQLAHYPNAMIFAAALAGAACLIVPTNWLTIPQAVFLGLAAAAIVRIAMKSLHFREARFQLTRQVASAVILFSVSGFDMHVNAQPLTTQDTTSVVEEHLPLVLLPIDLQGNQQGEDIYLSEEFLGTLQHSPGRVADVRAGPVLLSATYRGNLASDSEDIAATNNADLTDPWTLLWKVESYTANSRMHLPLRRDDAVWDQTAHRLDGVPVKLDWQQDGNGCSVVLPVAGIHWLQLVGQPRFTTNDRSARLRLHVPPLSGAELDLTLATNLDDLQVSGASRITGASTSTTNNARDQQQYLLGVRDAIDLRWTLNTAQSNAASWERLEQRSWLHVDQAAARLDVQLSVTGLRAPTQLLELDVSPQLKLLPPGEDSPIAEVMPPSPSHPTRVQLKLRPGLPANSVIPLRFELQRAVSVGRIFFPRVRMQGMAPAKNLFAVSVAAGFSYDEKVSNNLRSLEPADFSASWETTDEQPLYAYVLGQEEPEWSLRIWPDPQSLTAQQTLRVHCLPRQARVDFEVDVDDLTGSWLSHRLQVPASLQIDTITVQEASEDGSIPVRWSRSRVRETEVVVFLGRPVLQPHVLKLQGHINATADKEVDLPQVQLLDGERSEIRMDLYRTEDVRVSWSNSELVPNEIQQQRVSHSGAEIHLGHFSWRSSETGKFSRLRLESNIQEFETASVITVNLGLAGWTACLNSQIQVKQGVLSRLSLMAPDNFRAPYVLKPEQVGVIDEVRETPTGKEITLMLNQPASEGDEIEVRLSGSLSLPADRRLVVPSLQWKNAARRDRFVLLPTLIDGQSIYWKNKSGLRRRALPKKLSTFVSEGEAVLAFHIEQSQFEAEERSLRGSLRNALIRYGKVSGIIDAAGHLTVSAELVLQPGRATSCEIQLPPNSQLSQLVVGDLPVRRELLENDRWKVPLGPPFLPQRIVVNYRAQQELTGHQLRLTPPKIFLGDQELPAPRTWWRLRATGDLQVSKPSVGRLTDKFRFVTEAYRLPLLVLKDALSPALELPIQEGRAWFQAWQGITRQAEIDWRVYELSENEEFDLSTAQQTRLRYIEAFASNDPTRASRQSRLVYPPNLPMNPEVSPAGEELFFASDSKGQLVLTVSQGLKKNLWRWFAAVALVCGVLAVVLRLRHNPQWHHKLCHWPHSIAIGGGFVWWLLLKPSSVGMLVIALALISMAIKQWRQFRNHRQDKPNTQLAVPAS